MMSLSHEPGIQRKDIVTTSGKISITSDLGIAFDGHIRAAIAAPHAIETLL